jgi:exodeoxyribonuclease VII small subunit
MAEETRQNFEVALAELEGIVASLERGEPELTSALTKYEKGVQLLSICHRLLEKAEQSVAILTGVDDKGNALTVPFDGSATVASEVKVAPNVSDPSASERKRKATEKPVARRGRTAPADPTIDADDPPF